MVSPRLAFSSGWFNMVSYLETGWVRFPSSCVAVIQVISVKGLKRAVCHRTPPFLRHPYGALLITPTIENAVTNYLLEDNYR